MTVKKVYRLQDLDCANCAAKMERAIAKIDGVKAVSVAFMTQRLSIEAEESEMDSIMEKAVKICKKVEPDCQIKL